MSLGEFFFTPASLTIKTGDKVRWVNDGTVAHTTTSGVGGDFPGTPNGTWDSGNLGLGAGFSRTFDTPGTFNYFCSVHPILMGTATVTVEG